MPLAQDRGLSHRVVGMDYDSSEWQPASDELATRTRHTFAGSSDRSQQWEDHGCPRRAGTPTVNGSRVDRFSGDTSEEFLACSKATPSDGGSLDGQTGTPSDR